MNGCVQLRRSSIPCEAPDGKRDSPALVGRLVRCGQACAFSERDAWTPQNLLRVVWTLDHRARGPQRPPTDHTTTPLDFPSARWGGTHVVFANPLTIDEENDATAHPSRRRSSSRTTRHQSASRATRHEGGRGV